MTLEAVTAAITTSTAVRAPHTTRENTSYPPTVVPHRNSPPGAAWRGKVVPSAACWAKP